MPPLFIFLGLLMAEMAHGSPAADVLRSGIEAVSPITEGHFSVFSCVSSSRRGKNRITIQNDGRVVLQITEKKVATQCAVRIKKSRYEDATLQPLFHLSFTPGPCRPTPDSQTEEKWASSFELTTPLKGAPRGSLQWLKDETATPCKIQRLDKTHLKKLVRMKRLH